LQLKRSGYHPPVAQGVLVLRMFFPLFIFPQRVVPDAGLPIFSPGTLRTIRERVFPDLGFRVVFLSRPTSLPLFPNRFWLKSKVTTPHHQVLFYSEGGAESKKIPGTVPLSHIMVLRARLYHDDFFRKFPSLRLEEKFRG